MRFKKFFTIYEAISLAQAKKRNLSKKYGGAYRIDKAKELFGTKDRLVFDIDLDDADVIRKSNPLIGKINELLDQKFNGETRINSKKEYISGVIYDRKDVAKKQPKKIGRLLGKIGTPEAEELLKAFKVDPVRQTKGADGYSVVISRHPYDIAGMSTDRNWTSCMDLGTERLQYKGSYSNTGTYNRYVQADVRSGSLVAYLVSNTDRHKNGKLAVNKPLSRILLRPFINMEDPKDVVYGLGPMYGTKTQAFSDFIENWLKNEVNTNTKGKEYFKDTDVYPNDPDRPINFKVSTRKNTRGETYFFDALNEDIDNSKYINNFIVDVRETNDDMRLKFEVIFNIPTTIKLEPFSYDGWEAIPKAIPPHLQPAIDFYDYQQRYIQGGFERIIGVIENNQQKIKTTFFYEQPYYLYEDDDGNEMPIDDYERDNQWQQFIEALNVNDIDYKDAYENIIKSLKAHDPVKTQQDDMDRIQEEFNALIHPNSPRISPNGKKQIEQLQKIKPEFHQVLTYLKSLGRPTPEQLLELLRSSEFNDNFNRYKDIREIIDAVAKILRDFSPQSGYPYIDVYNIWHDLIHKFVGYDIEKSYDIKLKPHMVEFIPQWIEFKKNHSPEEIEYMEDLYEVFSQLRLD